MARRKIKYSDFHFSYQVEVYDKRTNRLLEVAKGWARRDTQEAENKMMWRIGMQLEYEFKKYNCIEEHMDYKIIKKEKQWDNPDLIPPEEKQ